MTTKVLLVEDEPEIRENVTEILDMEGFSVDAVCSAEEALQNYSQNKYDLILCDIMLNTPEHDGYYVLKSMKLNSDLVPPFIFITALSERSNQRMGMEYGADDYLTKPFLKDELLKSIKINIEKRKSLIDKFNIERDVLSLVKEITSAKQNGKNGNSKKVFDYNDSIFVSTKNKSEFVFLKNIVYIKSDRDYSEICTNTKKIFSIRKTLKSWLDILPKSHFVQIHRSIIVNLEYILRVEKWFNYSHRVFLKDFDDPFIISQRFSRKLKEKLKSF